MSVFYEPTDRRKACKALDVSSRRKFEFASPNISELRAMGNFIEPNCVVDTSSTLVELIQLSKIVSKYVNILIITLGSKGVVTVQRVIEKGKQCLHVRLYPTKALLHVENVSGAGDCFSSGFLYGTLLGLDESHCVSLGFEAAKQALLCKQTVPLTFHFKPNLEAAVFDISKYELSE